MLVRCVFFSGCLAIVAGCVLPFPSVVEDEDHLICPTPAEIAEFIRPGLKLYVGVKNNRGEYRECDNLNTMTIGRTWHVIDRPTSEEVLTMVRQSDLVWVDQTDRDTRTYIVAEIEENELVLVPGCEGPDSRTRLVLSAQSEISSCQRIMLRDVTRLVANVHPRLIEIEIEDVGNDYFSTTDGAIYRFAEIARLSKSIHRLEWEWEAGAPIFI